MVKRGDRGVSTLIGFILLFGILIVAFAIYQGLVIPEQNKQAEFDHNQEVQGQMLNLQDAIRRTGTTGVSQSVSIQVGADYPNRALGVNFAIGSGTVRTEEANPSGPNNITFENVRAVRDEVADYWNSSNPNTNLGFRTKDIVYDPQYTRYSDAPDTVYSNTGVFNTFDAANLSIADQILIRGNQITVVAINGSLSQSKSGNGASVPVSTEPLSVATNSITIENNGQGPMNLTVPTTVPNRTVWNRSLGGQDAVKSGGIAVSGNDVIIPLKNRTYSLRMAKIGVGSKTTDEDAEYIVPVDPPPRTVFNDTNHEVTVEVRDRFNNPNASTEVSATVVGDGSISPENGDRTTDSNGQVTFNYSAVAASGTGSATLVFNISDSEARNANDSKVVNHTVSIVKNNGGSANETEFAFVSVVQGPPTNVSGGSRHYITVETRNETHVINDTQIVASANHVGGTKDGQFASGNPTVPKSTDKNGQATFNYTAETNLASEDTVTLKFEITSGIDRRRNASLNITGGGVSGGGGGDGGSGGNVNPNSTGAVLLTSSEFGDPDGTTSPVKANATFENTGDTERNITDVRIAFYFGSSRPGGGGGGGSLISPESVAEINNVTTPGASRNFVTPGSYNIPTGFIEANTNEGTLAASNPGQTDELTLQFVFDSSSELDNGQAFFVMGIQFANGQRAEYFVSINN